MALRLLFGYVSTIANIDGIDSALMDNCFGAVVAHVAVVRAISVVLIVTQDSKHVQ